MKYLLVAFTMLAGAFVTDNPACAQQAKAYENVPYAAKKGTSTFQLEYADGYIGASKVVVKQPNKKLLLLPESGVPEANGDLRFSSKAGANDHELILSKIDESAVAPETIHAIYRVKGRALNLMFYKVKP